MSKKHAQSLSLTVRNLYVFCYLFLVLGLFIVMDVCQYSVYIKSVYHTCLFQRLSLRCWSAKAVHSGTHQDWSDALIYPDQLANKHIFIDFHYRVLLIFLL